MKLSKKLSLIFLIVLITLVTIALLISYEISKSSLRQAIFNHLRTTIVSRKEHVKTLIEEQKTIVDIIRKSIVIKGFLETAISDPNYTGKKKITLERIENIIKANNEIERISITNKEGVVILSSDEIFFGKDFSKEKLFLDAREQIFIHDVHFCNICKKHVINIAAPVIFEDNFLGNIILCIDLSHFYQILLDKTGLGETGEIYIVNMEKYAISPLRFKTDAVLQEKIETKNLLMCLKHSDEMHPPGCDKIIWIYSNYQGVLVLGTHEYIKELQWNLIAEISLNEVFKPLVKLRIALIIWVLLFILVSFLLGNSLARFITKPIIILKDGTKIISKGNLDYQVVIERNDEIGELASNFNQMVLSLKDSTKSLKTEIRKREEVEKILREQAKDLENSLSEKNLLLQEIHHRVKNNMQLISSLLSLQLKFSKGKSFEELLRESQNRINIMLVIYEKLYKTQNFTEVNINNYISLLMSDLKKVFQSPNLEIELEINIPDILFKPERIIYCGMIINELVTNSFKYAFRDLVKGKITIELSEDSNNKFKLLIMDNGCGLPEDFDFDETTTLGLQLVKTLVEDQLQGTIEVKIDKGTEYIIVFNKNDIT